LTSFLWVYDTVTKRVLSANSLSPSLLFGIIFHQVYGGIMSQRKIRVLIAKPGLDGHDRGAKVVARALRDAGMEVIYTGLRQTPEMIAEAALQEDVDAVGLSVLSGAHMALVPRVLELLKANGQVHVKVFLGGIVPDEDVPTLLKMGVIGIYGPGTLSDSYVKDIRKAVLAEEP
jgi:methylmalonyl-CoA mutase C-terminal domain/subunit